MRASAIAVLALLLAGPAWAQSEREGLPPDPRATRLDTQERQMLGALARNAATAQQLGSLASNRSGQSRLGQLGQSMAVTNAGLSMQLMELAGAENLPMRERVDQAEIQRLQAMAGSDRQNFSREVLGWINRNYPDTIRNMDALGRRDTRYAALAETTLPQLREQLSAAQELAQAAMEGTPPRDH